MEVFTIAYTFSKVEGVKAVFATGNEHRCIFINQDGEVIIRGMNLNDELLSYAQIKYLDPVMMSVSKPMIPKFKAIKAATNNNMAFYITPNNDLIVAGGGFYQFDIPNIIDISACGYSAVAISADYDVYVWGKLPFTNTQVIDENGIVKPFATKLFDFKAKSVSCGRNITAFITPDDDVYITKPKHFYDHHTVTFGVQLEKVPDFKATYVACHRDNVCFINSEMEVFMSRVPVAYNPPQKVEGIKGISAVMHNNLSYVVCPNGDLRLVHEINENEWMATGVVFEEKMLLRPKNMKSAKRA